MVRLLKTYVTQGKVQKGWSVMSAGGHKVRTKRGLVKVLQRLASSTVDSPEARFSGQPATVAFEFGTSQLVSSSSSSSSAAAALAAAGAGVDRSASLVRHPKHGYGLDVSDSLVVTSVRGPALGVVEPGWRVVAVDGGAVSSKKQLAVALHAATVGEAVRFTLRQDAAASSPRGADGTGGTSRVTLRRHAKHGYGLDLSGDLTVASLRSDTDAASKVAVGWRLVAVGGATVSTKRQLVAVLASSSSISSAATTGGTTTAEKTIAFTTEFAFQHSSATLPTAAVATTAAAANDAQSAERMRMLVLPRHPKHGFGLDVDDSLTIMAVSRSPRKPAAAEKTMTPAAAQLPPPGSRLLAVNGVGISSKLQLAKALAQPETIESAEFSFRFPAAVVAAAGVTSGGSETRYAAAAAAQRPQESVYTTTCLRTRSLSLTHTCLCHR
jgi:hypothetical protein